MSSRILVAKCGIDKHDRGAIIVSRALRDAGHEVIYIPSGYTPAELARAATDEGVDAAGISLHSGAHLSIFSEFVPLVRDGASRRIAIFAGGTIPARDIAELHRLGVDEVFTAGITLVDLTERIAAHLRAVDGV